MTPPTCAAPGCANPVPRRPGPGRPAIYCTPDCRPTPPPGGPITVTLDHASETAGGAGWTVTLRRGPHTVTIADNLGRFAAILLRDDIQRLLHPRQQKGAPT